MEEANSRNLYADLGLADNWPSLSEIDLAYVELVSKLSPEVNPAAAPADAAEMAKIKSAYEILRDPDKRAEYNRTHADLFKHKRKSAMRRRYKPSWRAPLDQMLRVARMQLASGVWQERRTRQLPHNTQLRATAQLRAHANHLDLFHALSRSHGKAVALHHVGLGPVEEVPQYWKAFDPASQLHRKNLEKHQRTRKQARKRALAALLDRQAMIREEEAAREKAAAERDRAREIKWINQEAEESIGKLAKMAQRVYPVSELSGYELVLYQQSARKAAEKADDLLEFLWDKVHSGTWVVPDVKEGLDLVELLRSVWEPEAPDSYRYFSASTQLLATSLLRKLRGEVFDETGDGLRLLSTTEVDEKPFSDTMDSAERKGVEELVQGANSQPHPQATEPQQAHSSQHPQTVSPFAIYYKWQNDIGVQAPAAGSKRKRSPFDEQSTQPSKRQKRARYT